MDYNALLDIAEEIGYQLAMGGAETFRVEESIGRIMAAYGIHAEVFAIPNCLHVSIETPEGTAITRMRRIGSHGNDLDAVEKYNNLSRRLCDEKPELHTAAQWLNKTANTRKVYCLPMHLLGNFLGACGFAIMFGGNYVDSICAGLCGIVVGLVNTFTERLKANQFFRLIASSFLMALLAYLTGICGIANNTDAVIIGTLMILVPGLLFTNAMRDIIYGDTNSGINRIVQVLLIAAAIALGTGAALNLTDTLFHTSIVSTTVTHSLAVTAIASFVGCVGFFIVFNIHGPGGFLCALGGLITWVAYSLMVKLGINDVMAYFIATMIAALYSESMARLRKYPAISYLLISVFPLIPGAGIYYTTNHLVRGDMASFASVGGKTIAIAGAMAVGILLISTVFRLITLRKNKAK